MVRIAVLGCGILGLKVAGTLAYYGHLVKVYDKNLRELDSVCERIHHDEDQYYRDGLIETPKFLVNLSLCQARCSSTLSHLALSRVKFYV